MGRPRLVMTLALLMVLGIGGKCGGGSGGGGSPSVRAIDSPDARCAAQASEFPPGFDFVPGMDSLAFVADLGGSGGPLINGFTTTSAPPVLRGAFSLDLATDFDSDGDGRKEPAQTFGLTPIFDGIHIESPQLALVTASSYEEVLFFAPDTGSLRAFDVAVPAGFEPGDNPFLPAPGTTGSRTGLSTFACARPAAGALDSRGDPIATSIPAVGFCDPNVPSYYATFTSGAVIAAGHLFVSASNLGDDPGTANTQYLPGTVLVYDVDLGTTPPAISPNELTPVIFTEGFNPSHVTRYEVGGREFVLVSASGAIGIGADPFGIALTEASIDVIDADSLELVATYPLGLAGLASTELAIDESGRVAVAGSSVSRHLFAIDLEPLATLPSSVLSPQILDGVGGPDGVIFDADDPFVVPPLPNGAPPAMCPGFTAGASFAGARLFATESCDGALAVVDVDLVGNPPVPVPQDRFDLLEVLDIAAPVRDDSLGDAILPSEVRARSLAPIGEPNVFFLLGQPEGLLCGIRVD